jgi:hypothetical protein
VKVIHLHETAAKLIDVEFLRLAGINVCVKQNISKVL